MPTIFSHPAVPLALGFGLGKEIVSRRLLLAGVAASILPDLDVVAFSFGIPYEDQFGHRGFSHSFFFAALVALIGACVHRSLDSSFGIAFAFLFLAAASHGVLDAFTNGGLGIALFWPWSGARYFARYQLIEVAPISLSYFLSSRGVRVLLSELRWIWLPCGLLVIGLAVIRRRLGKKPPA
jgi:inner membrane protein